MFEQTDQDMKPVNDPEHGAAPDSTENKTNLTIITEIDSTTKLRSYEMLTFKDLLPNKITVPVMNKEKITTVYIMQI